MLLLSPLPHYAMPPSMPFFDDMLLDAHIISLTLLMLSLIIDGFSPPPVCLMFRYMLHAAPRYFA